MVENFLFRDRDGQTPLPIELRKGLLLKNVQTVGDLDEFEEDNIAEGLVWLEGYQKDYISYDFWIELHKRLFKDVWEWAGKVRQHELNNFDFLKPHEIWSALKLLEDDLKFWISNDCFSSGEIAARFHERIETIHAFANGNGRHGRILTEYICQRNKTAVPTWGEALKHNPKERRRNYIEALSNARSTKIYAPLIEMMFS